MDGYDKLTFIDKIRFKLRVRKQEKIENKRQNIEHDDRMPVDTQKIINELLAERENKKNKAKSLPAPEFSENKVVKRENKLDQYKVPENTIKSPIEMHMEREQKRLDYILGKEIKSETDAYENIVDLQSFLSYPHDYLPYAEQKVNEKLYNIQNILGHDILNKGIQIYEYDKSLKEMYSTIPVEKRCKLEQEIINNPKLSQDLAFLRYNPEESRKQTGGIVDYQAVYSKMTEKAKDNEYDRHYKNSNELEER